jgi:hypothetical protein
VNYNASTRRLNVAGQIEHYDRGFVMDTAFLNRTGFTVGWGFVDYSFYPDKTKYPWLRRIRPFTFTQGGQDRVGDGSELLNVTGVRFHFTRQGFFRIDRFFGHEPWLGERFDIGRWRMMGEVQLFRWLGLNAYWHSGHSIFYDDVDPFGGDETRFNVSLNLQPTGRLLQSVAYTRVTFDRLDGGDRAYDVDIVNTKTSYQFTRAFSLRAIAQYDSSQYRVLTDFLSSYELKPGTVVYAGYGSLYERRDFRDEEWILGEGGYRASRRGLFFKASYLHRF